MDFSQNRAIFPVTGEPMADFLTALDYVVGTPPGTGNEGGLSPDGQTIYGITVADAATMGYTGSMINFPPSLVAPFYESNYWTPLNLDTVQAQGPATAILDMAILTGQGGAGQITQAALAGLGWQGTQDGLIGPDTLAGVNGTDPNAFVSAFSDQAALYLQNLAASAQNPGWKDRAARLATLQTGIEGAIAQVTTHPTTSALIASFIIGGLILWGRKS